LTAGIVSRALAAMNGTDEWSDIVGEILTRFHGQNGHPPPPVEARCAFAARLHALIEERGLPPLLAAGESGKPGGMSEVECAPLIARVLGGAAEPLLAEAARQLVKACFYPEFKVCRDSFREKSPDGACRRQELARARGRLSGSHCVDCPHWIALEREPHRVMLERAWCGDAAEFREHRDVFLPEDFRRLRRWLHAAARESAR
jgi:hypothetical protein